MVWSDASSHLYTMMTAPVPHSFHRDIQSANIYLTENFTAQLMDSGLARFVPSDTNTSSTMLVMNDSPRTHVYMDPKFLENSNSSLRYSYEAAYDVYSVGVVMMEIIVGCLIVVTVK
jgi:serine/threonine protein kinase